MVEAGDLELINISYNFQNHFRSSWVEAMNEFTEVTKLVEEFGLELRRIKLFDKLNYKMNILNFIRLSFSRDSTL